MRDAIARGQAQTRPTWGGPGTVVPPMPLFACAFAVGFWLDRQWSWPIQADGVLELIGIVGTAVAATGLLVFLAGLRKFAREGTGILLQRTATHVVTSGPYRWSRNPMYVGFVAVYVGGALLANTIWPLILLPIVIALLTRFVIEREEQYMHATFGLDYGEYTRRVPRWL